MSSTDLMALAMRMGLEGAELKTWIDEREARAREERAAEREAKKEQMQLQLQVEEQAQRTIQLRLQLTQTETAREPVGADIGRSSRVSSNVNPHNFIPGFDENRDDLDAYLKRFENVATGQEWPRDKWATALSLCLSGEALKVFGRLSPEDALDYEKVKLALFQRFRFTAEGYREKFRHSKPQEGETGRQYAARLMSFFDRWVEMSKVDKEYASVRDLIVAEQFISKCHDRVALFLREKNCRKLEEMAEAADQFLEAQRQSNLLVFREKAENGMAVKSGSTTSKTSVQCFVCNKIGHKASDCRARTKQPYCGHCRRAGHDTQVCTKKPATYKKASCILSEENSKDNDNASGGGSENNVSGAVNTQQMATKYQMPVLQGLLFGKPVSVLRDTGSNTTVVRRSLVPDEVLTGAMTTVFLADGSRIKVPEAKVEIFSPYFSGTVIVKCMTSPLYDVIVGNVPGSRDPNDPDSRWSEGLSERKTKSKSVKERLGVMKADRYERPMISVVKNSSTSLDSVKATALNINQRIFKIEQAEDKSLDLCRNKVGQVFFGRGSTEYSFVMQKGVLYRHYRLSSGKIVQQVVVPRKLRSQVLQLAHESLMAGHQGIKRTIDRVLGSFYWPGVQEEVKRYVRSCDICQRAYPKGKVGKAPLGVMPLIDTPFERVAIDIIGPLKPVSRNGNRYILTMVDFATRYPDAVALPAIDSATVTEGLVEMFSRVGFPREILCDQASCFTSELMKEVNELLAIKHLSSTPYHPMCNGLVERFNGTLKQMLRKLCQEEPRSWDRLLAPLLFAYREVPQTSTGFSPFELIYGRDVRGPLSLLKELWIGEHIGDEAKTTYGYVLDLRDRLEKTLQLAHENLTRARKSQKQYYDQRSTKRQLEVGDRALILLPTTENKLLMQWKGPFKVTGKKGSHDYWLDLGRDTKLFHINMLKRYEDREPERFTQTASFVVMEEEEADSPIPVYTIDQGTGVETINIGEGLAEEEAAELQRILTKYQDVFSEMPGKTNLLECPLRLTTPDPICTPQYPLPLAMKEVVEKEVRDMLKLGVIERSNSPYNSPLVLIKKPDQTYRTCIDFRRINEVLISDAEPIPRTDMMFAEVGTKRFFSKFDLTKGYWQVPLELESRSVTAFSTQTGHYHFIYMPFGIKTASAVFTRLMRTLLQGLPNVAHYIDDVLIATMTWKEHLDTLQQFLHRVREAGLTIKPQKCEIAMTSVVFLGHRLGGGTIRAVDSTVEKIANAQKPQTKKQLRSFLGLAGYYRDMIPHYAEKAQPLTELTRKKERNKICWNPEREAAFETLKQALASGPIVKAPDPERRFVLRSDASDTCIGAILMQEHDGLLHPVSYASRQLLPREKNYSTIERECLALVWAVQRFHIFLYGNQFVVQTDHQPLQYLARAKHLNSRVLRWSLALQEYSFSIQHIKGSENTGADFMSRL